MSEATAVTRSRTLKSGGSSSKSTGLPLGWLSQLNLQDPWSLRLLLATPFERGRHACSNPQPPSQRCIHRRVTTYETRMVKNNILKSGNAQRSDIFFCGSGYICVKPGSKIIPQFQFANNLLITQKVSTCSGDVDTDRPRSGGLFIPDLVRIVGFLDLLELSSMKAVKVFLVFFGEPPCT